jgi:nucleoside 2-deoxyribosyltransferase
MSSFYQANRYEEATKWREYSKQRLNDIGIKIFDPTDKSLTHFTYPESTHNGIILQNYIYLKKCDAVLVSLEMFEDSVGSIWEVSMAWAEHKPVIAFGNCEKWKDRPHFKSLITVQFDTVKEACEYILSMYSQNI